MTTEGLALKNFERGGGRVSLTVDGRHVWAFKGETISALLVRLGQFGSRRSRQRGELRGYYCGMGACFECQVRMDGRSVQGCLLFAQAGMVIETDVADTQGTGRE